MRFTFYLLYLLTYLQQYRACYQFQNWLKLRLKATAVNGAGHASGRHGNKSTWFNLRPIKLLPQTNEWISVYAVILLAINTNTRAKNVRLSYAAANHCTVNFVVYLVKSRLLELSLVLFSCSFLIIIFVCYLSFLPFVVNKDFQNTEIRILSPCIPATDIASSSISVPYILQSSSSSSSTMNIRKLA